MADTISDLTSAINTYIVAPLNAFGQGGFVFDIQSEEHATLAAEITDHYTEDNKAVQDHIALRPKRITLRGYVGELVYDKPNGNSPGILQQITQKLTVISAYLPQISAAATQAQSSINGIQSAGGTLASLEGSVPAAANIYGLVQNALGFAGDMAKQQSAYQYFAACQSAGILMGVQTPWEFLTNMAIETIEAIQPEESIFVTDFSITYKQIRIAATETITAASLLNGTGGTPTPGGPTVQFPSSAQGAATINNGVTQGSPSNFSLSNLANNPLAGVFSNAIN